MNKLTFDEHDGKTTHTLKGQPIHASALEEETFFSAVEGIKQGFKGTFDQLDAYMAKVRIQPQN